MIPYSSQSPYFPFFPLTPASAAHTAMTRMIGSFTLGQYLGLVALTLGSMLAGASCVHAYYKPDLVRMMP